MANKPQNQAPEAVKPPDGLDQIAPQAAGFWKPVSGKPLYCKLVDFQQRFDGSGFLFIGELLAPCLATTGKGNDAKEIELQTGELIAFDERAGLKPLRLYVENKGVVWINPKEKKPTSDRKKSFWVFDIRGKGKKAPLIMQAHELAAGGAGEPEDALPI